MMFAFPEHKIYGRKTKAVGQPRGAGAGGYFTLPTPNDALINGFQLEKNKDLIVSGGSKNNNRLHCDGKRGCI